MKQLLTVFLPILVISFIFLAVYENGEKGSSSNLSSEKEKWVGAWTASMQAPFKDGISHEGFEDQTLRFVVHPSAEGDNIRLRLSNAFGEEPLKIEEVRVAVSTKGPDIISGTDQQVTFGGDKQVTIPAGEREFSDSIPADLTHGKDLVVSLYVQDKTGPATWHPKSMQTTYITSGNHVLDADESAFSTKEEAWFWLDGVDVTAASTEDEALVIVGSSIENGNYSTVDANHRWSDFLAKRLNQKASVNHISVLNAGISANQLINSSMDKGENTLARLERDVFSQSGVKAVILHQGLNDIRHYPEYDADKIIAALKEVIDSTHDEGLKIYGSTLTPFRGSGKYTEKGEETRQKVNDWIRTSGEFDGVIDFDKALRDPDDPKRYLPEYDAGDHLHPNDAGYKKMAEAVDLSMFE
ncbi:SGNH/GDSL hydrolase family protein [Jeotgalibacillus sp. S-D1]|uniref:SGNH/GDSL hydrolase family protein n=1 Tax=Jeotgalibacillus sp. S-D1 TaxID=2552189 RepID=UPI00105A9911|nr:SGNH/GDSL hydrolase family protein [Jeotgalibacillus sp. S-D1]TDL31032.1 SGNH/GDSL hydrolase family protein [Jeotgalibacillus sp. S-D1]